MSSHSRRDDRDRRHSSSNRRDSSRRDRDSNRRSSPGPSRGRSPPPPSRPRDDDELPTEFGRPMESTSREDENTVLRRMRTAFTNSPLKVIQNCVADNIKIKIWTRNFKEVRGICTGYVIAFDKHWNLVLSDVEEVFLKPKKAKTPYLLDVENGNDMPELPPKVPRERKTKTPEEEAAKKKAEEAAKKKAEEAAKKKAEEEATTKKKTEVEASKKSKKNDGNRRVNKRHLKQLFVRGDNIVMCAIFEDSPAATN